MASSECVRKKLGTNSILIGGKFDIHCFSKIFMKRFSLGACPESVFFSLEERREEKIASSYARVIL